MGTLPLRAASYIMSLHRISQDHRLLFVTGVLNDPFPQSSFPTCNTTSPSKHMSLKTTNHMRGSTHVDRSVVFWSSLVRLAKWLANSSIRVKSMVIGWCSIVNPPLSAAGHPSIPPAAPPSLGTPKRTLRQDLPSWYWVCSMDHRLS